MGSKRITAAAASVALCGALLAPAVVGSARAWAAAGSFDPTFGTSGQVSLSTGSGATGVVQLGTGGYVVSGDSGAGQFRVTAVASSGAQTASDAVGAGQAQSVALLPDGNIVAAGYLANTSCPSSQQDPAVVVLNPTGGMSVVATVKMPCGALGASFAGVAVDPATGDIYAAGTIFGGGPGTETVVARLARTGSSDSTYAVDGTFGTAGEYVAAVGGNPSVANGVAWSAARGEALVVGTESATQQTFQYVLALTSGGALDTSTTTPFGTSGIYTGAAGTKGAGIAVESPGGTAPGTVFVAGTNANQGSVVSLTSSGALAWPATSPSAATLSSVAYQPNGNTVTAVGQTTNSKTGQMVAVQYNASSGLINTGFGQSGTVQSSYSGPANAYAVTVQADGGVVAAGVTGGATNIGMVRLLGPTVSVSSPAVVNTTTAGQVTIVYTLTLDEFLFSNVPVTFCGPAGSIIVGGTTNCGQIVVQAGQSTATVSLNVDVNYTAGNQAGFTGVIQAGGGITPNPAQGASTTTVRHIPPPPAQVGYWMVASDGGIFAFHEGFYGSTGGVPLVQPIVGMAATSDGKGYWLVASDGGIFAFGDAHFYGSTGGVPLTRPIVGMAATPDGQGYWLVASDGGIFAFGDAHFFGSTGGVPLVKPIVGMAATPDGQGYWLVASDGGVFSFGDATFHGSTGGVPLVKPIVGMAADPGGSGYWMVASDGGIFSFGNASFYGSTGGVALVKPIVGMSPTADGLGYWLVASDGGIFSFGDAQFFGSTGGISLTRPIVAMNI
ncbi:MAG: hypothetical protein KGQ66_04915 [Acidobacteriota bacterium]|nr:hypothetical protein [Acidobacteriota bacterium]